MKTNSLLLLSCAFYGCSFCQAQTVHVPIRTPYADAGVYSNSFSNTFSAAANPAVLSTLKNASAGLYGERRFMLRELQLAKFVVNLPLEKSGIGFQSAYFGSATYNESSIGVCYGRELNSNVSVGIQFNYSILHSNIFGNVGTVHGAIGARFKPSEKLKFGLLIYNPFSAKLGKSAAEKFASVYKIGIGYEPVQDLAISVEIIKEEGNEVFSNTCLQYKFSDAAFATAGWLSANGSPYAGCGLKWRLIRLDITVSYLSPLGFSPGLQLLFFFNKNAR